MKFEKYILKSGEVKWNFYHYFGINPDTGRKEDVERRGVDTKAEAREVLLKIFNEYEKSQEYKSAQKNRYRFSEVTDLWLMHYKQKVMITTFATTQSYLKNHILPQYSNYYIDRISVRQFQDVVNLWYVSYTEASLLANITSRIFKFGINQGFCSDSPMDKVIRPKNTQ